VQGRRGGDIGEALGAAKNGVEGIAGPDLGGIDELAMYAEEIALDLAIGAVGQLVAEPDMQDARPLSLDDA
jgi:hypothetical protein